MCFIFLVFFSVCLSYLYGPCYLITNTCSKVVVGVLQVHVWTLRNEDRYLAWDFEQDVHNAYDLYLSLNVDGMFTDFPQSLARHLDLVYSNIKAESNGGTKCRWDRIKSANFDK